ADALHEPQSPTPTTTTSHVDTNSESMSGGTCSVMDIFLRRTTPATPCSCCSSAPTSSRNCSALRLTFASRPTRLPRRSGLRAARTVARTPVAGPAVGSTIALNIAGSLHYGRLNGASTDDRGVMTPLAGAVAVAAGSSSPTGSGKWQAT